MLEILDYLASKPILILFIGILIGYLLRRSQKERFKSISSSKKDVFSSEDKRVRINPVFNKNASLDFKPSLLSSSTRKDIFTKIKGIDEEMQNKLYHLGVYQYDQISSWSSKNCEWIENFLGLSGYIKDNQWVEQAKILRTGKETNYSQRLIDEESEENNNIAENEKSENDEINKKDIE